MAPKKINEKYLIIYKFAFIPKKFNTKKIILL
jgi:hypothetical protein